MKDVRDYLRELWAAFRHGWNRFWFTPQDAATLGVIRILAGAMLLYTHAVWTLDLEGFFGAGGRLSVEFVKQRQGSPFAWSHLYGMDSPTALWVTHGLALACFFCLMIGWGTRIAAWLSWLFTISYAHRAAGALFGLDQINGMMAFYLAVGPAGDAFSCDAWWRRRRGRAGGQPSVGANLAIRLLQCHMCVIYLFAGLGKLLGQTWWAGTALWGAFANLEYQTMDMTWVAHYPLVVNLITHTILVWEIAYIGLIWPRLTRPLMLAMAIPLHLGIAFTMGMVTFGVIMLVGNFSFVSPRMVRKWVGGAISHDNAASVERSLSTSRRGTGRGLARHQAGH